MIKMVRRVSRDHIIIISNIHVHVYTFVMTMCRIYDSARLDPDHAPAPGDLDNIDSFGLKTQTRQ